MIDTQPTTCNLCGGKVILCSNARVYHGREYGSGRCYYCLGCGAYVGTHKPRPEEAMGLLADEPMRKGKKLCHALFDTLWQADEGYVALWEEMPCWRSPWRRPAPARRRQAYPSTAGWPGRWVFP